ncbi:MULTISPECIES: TrgA family protein [Salipiger]|jgi:hypothetical protein|uniref:Tellurite resistance protein TrgA n=1 Tax=Salipiger profundus TaxID=1229727 RepID=A0A1U7DAI1_9RHOB|nr:MULTISPECIES: TrgA family protein [Salipiger]APX25070.1 Tellurite resistance protein TrgA [Salipiger profundus]GGA15171.1 tellurium resistance protein [Salipiger profundus]SFD11504.1 hypothetical protein SAMN05444415_107223 [Salipiger profundus]|tara:strand:+ start:208 stop:648 length:441 start_codon:yes stop_codon:yes gene_type:complete
MFTAARLIAALCLAAVGYLGSVYVHKLMPDIQDFGILDYVNAAIGFLCGWIIVGPRAGRGMSAALSHGITGTVALVFWALMVQAANEMVHLALRHRYSSAMDAFAAIFEIAAEYGALLLDTGFFLLMVLGAVVTGILSESASRRWR